MTVLGAAILIVFAIAALFFVLYGRANTWALITGPNDPGPYDFATESRRKTGNDALACSPGLCRSADWTLPFYDVAPRGLIGELAARLKRIDTRAERVDDGSRPDYARFLTFSPVMRFPDAIDLEAERLPDGRTGLRIYSRAKLGSRDFGKNREHIMNLMRGFRP